MVKHFCAAFYILLFVRISCANSGLNSNKCSRDTSDMMSSNKTAMLAKGTKPSNYWKKIRLKPIKTETSTKKLTKIDVFSLLFRHEGSDAIKRNLDKFSMVRKKTFTLPDYEEDVHTLTVIPLKNKKNLHSAKEHYKKHKNIKLFELRQSPEKKLLMSDKDKYEKTMYALLTKQNDLVRKLIERLKDEKILRVGKTSDFDDVIKLADIIKAKREVLNVSDTTMDVVINFNKKSNVTVAPKKPKKKIMTMVDETDVRNALKNNSYIPRILKIAHKKRQKYLKEAKLHFADDVEQID